jgi:hypothetical protein
MPRLIDLKPGQVWLGKGGRKVARRIVDVEDVALTVEVLPSGEIVPASKHRFVIYSTGGDGLHGCKRESFLRWRGRPYDERHGQKGALV